MDLNLAASEQRLLAALPKDGAPASAASLVGKGFASETEVLQATGGPERHGLVAIHEARRQAVELTAEGRKAAQEGLPERKAVRAILAAGGKVALDRLARDGIGRDEARVAVGWLRRKGWAAMEKGPGGATLSASKEPAPDAHEAALREPGSAPAAVLSDLAQRGLVTLKESATRSIALTAKGQAFAKTLRPEAIGVEVNQITPELVARWPTMPPEERARHRIRPFDFDVPVTVPSPGKAHPLTYILSEIRAIFWSMGFQEIAGDYVESAFWNMDALFIPQDHPAREMQDTFYLSDPASIQVPKADLDRGEEVHVRGGKTGSTGWGGAFDRGVAQKALLRTHTTNTTIRHLAANPKGAHKVFGLGRVFRKETMDATHLPEFTQIEGIVTEPGASFNTLVGLCRFFFGKMGFPQVRFRPAYFPYTEPSMEIEVFYNGRWMELGGCGIFRPEVCQPLGVENPVLAWGFGLERLAMMRLGLKDIRGLYISDVQWLRETPVR